MCCFEHNSVELDIYANQMKPASISNLFEDKNCTSTQCGNNYDTNKFLIYLPRELRFE